MIHISFIQSFRRIIVNTGLVFFVFFSSVVWAQPELGHNMTAISKPKSAPNFILQDMDEEKQSLDTNKGKVVLLNFWATWCPPCKREMPSMERLYQKFKNDKFNVIAIDQMEDIDTVFSFTGQLPIDPTFPILFDTNSTVSRAYGVNGLPTTYLIDKKGNVRYRAIGGREFDHEDIEKLIQQLINE